MNLKIKNTGELLTFATPQDAAEHLQAFGFINEVSANPFLDIATAAKKGVIEIVKNDPPKEERPTGADELLKQLGKYIAPSVNEADVQTIVNKSLDKTLRQFNKMLDEAVKNIPAKEVNIKIADKITTLEEYVHPMFERLLFFSANRQNVWLTGGAGSGKTTAAKQVAKALNLPFYCTSVCSQTPESKLTGYMSATGEYIESLFYKAYKNGGVYLFDEIDNGNPNTLTALNAAIENGICAFPHEMVEKHPDFICIAAANTIGQGGNLQYVGRNKIEAPTLDRFAFIHWGYDNDFELKIAPVPAFTKKVQELRSRAEKLGLRCIISPRASINGGRMIQAGMSEADVLEAYIYAKLTQQEREALC